MPATFLINPEDDSRITIQAANNLRKELSTSIPDHPLASLDTASDHIVVKPRTFSVSGTITEAYLNKGDGDGYLTPKEFDIALERIIDRRVPFQFYLDDETFVNVPENVFILNYTVIKTEKEGLTSFSVNLRIKEILKGELAQEVEIPQEAYNKLVTSKKDVGSQSTKEATDTEKAKGNEKLSRALILSQGGSGATN